MLLNLTMLHVRYMVVVMVMPVMVPVRMVMMVTRNDSREEGFTVTVRLRIIRMIVRRDQVRWWRGVRVPDKLLL